MSASVLVLASCLVIFALAVAASWVWALLRVDKERSVAIAELASDPIVAVTANAHHEQILAVDVEEAQRLSETAMRRLHGRGITAEGAVITGWVGSQLRFGEFQLIVVLTEATQGRTHVRCGARARFVQAGPARLLSRRWTARLATEIGLVARAASG